MAVLGFQRSWLKLAFANSEKQVFFIDLSDPFCFPARGLTIVLHTTSYISDPIGGEFVEDKTRRAVNYHGPSLGPSLVLITHITHVTQNHRTHFTPD